MRVEGPGIQLVYTRYTAVILATWEAIGRRIMI
jgi:hypothetical protein